MGWARHPRGAPRRFIGDDNDIFGATIDVDRRTAWLLRVARVASPWGNRPAASFVARLREVGVREVHPSRVTWWESGAPVSVALIAAYERALGLHPGRLQGPVASMRLTSDHRAPIESVPDGLDRLGLFRLQGEVTDRVEAGAATAGDWLTLAGLLTAPGSVPPPSGVVEPWVHRLLVEFVRSVNDDYTSGWSALAALLADPVMAPIVRDQALAVLGELGVPFARLIWDVLAQDAGAGASADYARGLLSGDQERLLGVTFGLATMLGRRQVAAGEIHRMVDILRQLATGGEDEREIAFMFAARLGGPVPALLGAPIRVTATGLRRQLEQPPYLAAFVKRVRAESGIADDPMIVRLLQEALSHHFLDKRQLASQLIAASPYRESVAAAAIDMAKTAPDAPDRLTAALLLRQVAVPEMTGVRSLLASPDLTVVGHALLAIVRGGAELPRDLRPWLADRRTYDQAVLAANMGGIPLPAASPAEQSAQRWWADHGTLVNSATESVAHMADPQVG